MSVAKMSTGARTDEGIASRLAAVEILYRVDQEAAYADVLLGGRLPDFAPADRRLITRLVLGTLAWRGRLDFELAHLTGRKLDGIQPAALAIMRMGLFQLRYLDRIPQHAVVDTAVSIAKRIPETLVLSGAPKFESRAYREGLFHAQSEASQIAARMLACRAGATVVDCAA